MVIKYIQRINKIKLKKQKKQKKCDTKRKMLGRLPHPFLHFKKKV